MRMLILTIVLLLAGCAGTAPEQAAGATEAKDNGKQAYLDYCAGCHETGMFNAPIVGDAQYWEGRSTLWQAVLMEHAKTGYFDMPAKGSRPDLPDETIDAATEYMLSITFPDLPRDR